MEVLQVPLHLCDNVHALQPPEVIAAATDEQDSRGGLPPEHPLDGGAQTTPPQPPSAEPLNLGSQAEIRPSGLGCPVTASADIAVPNDPYCGNCNSNIDNNKY